MPTLTVKLDRKHSARLAKLARTRKLTKSDVIRQLIDRAGRIETGDDLIAWVAAAEGVGLGFEQRRR
jgi:predicted transcriptional regulator